MHKPMFDLSEVVPIGINDLFLQTFDLSEVIPNFDASALGEGAMKK
jgi:hypothetical protein